jgi:hypothetical protein
MTAPHQPDQQQPYQPPIHEHPYAPPIPEQQYSLPTSGPLPRIRPPDTEQSHHRQPDPEQPDEPPVYPEQPHLDPYQPQPYPEQPYQQQAYPDPHQQQAYPQAYPDPYQQQAYPEQPYGRHADDEQAHRQAAHRPETPARHREPPAAVGPVSRRRRFGVLAWSALVLGIVGGVGVVGGVVGSPIVFPDNLTTVVAGVGAVLGVIALFGARKALAGLGVVLCAAVIVFTVVAQGGAVAEPGGLAGEDSAAMQDVTVHDCAVVDRGDELVMAEATIEITNGTGERQSYNVTVNVNDGRGARVAEINAIATALEPGQSVVLSGANASGAATERAKTGPADCQVASVNRLALGG